jgi:hypothetical protein
MAAYTFYIGSLDALSQLYLNFGVIPGYLLFKCVMLLLGLMMA